MDRMTTILVTVLSILCLWLGENSAEGKCRGLWKNHHACLGGNGKRSDPSGAEATDQSSNLLESILRANALPPSESERYIPKPDYQPELNYGGNPETNRDLYTIKLQELVRKLVQVLREDERSEE